ncbi:RNA binding protein, heterogenous nuclear RNP-K like protein [Basidiobolus ranarum]|uniref:RNA binding protein, heterogenous nuclear RNP-K like protein n=1 Tax=Basidiobolus ranarum TaxID=34480 RepID=A0ABR2VYN9_9FUNG
MPPATPKILSLYDSGFVLFPDNDSLNLKTSPPPLSPNNITNFFSSLSRRSFTSRVDPMSSLPSTISSEDSLFSFPSYSQRNLPPGFDVDIPSPEMSFADFPHEDTTHHFTRMPFDQSCNYDAHTSSARPFLDPTSVSDSPVSAFARCASNPSDILSHDSKPSLGNFTLRSLVTSKDAGIIIGKSGRNVAALRDSTGVKAGVSKVVQGVPDRVLSVTGTLLGVAKAYSMTVQALLDNSPDVQETTIIDPASADGKTGAIRLLISHNLMGTVIGRQGVKIKQIQDLSHARMVASKELLPQSTERVIEIQGSSEAIRIAILEIGKCLIEDWERGAGTVFYHPANVIGLCNREREKQDRERDFPKRSIARASGVSDFNYPGPSVDDFYDNTPTSREPFTKAITSREISIPGDLVGCIIGKGGSKISEIRRMSSSRISIEKVPRGDVGERRFIIRGAKEENDRVVDLLIEMVEQERQRRKLEAEQLAMEHGVWRPVSVDHY